ncbi:MAG: plastocyanin/azurin family copper-binding protein, partial [Litorilinea sp.]
MLFCIESIGAPRAAYRKPILLWAIVVWVSLTLAACGKSESHEAMPAHAPAASQSSSGTGLGVDRPVRDATTVDVTIFDFGYELDVSDLVPGAVQFVVTNTGNMPHDFAIRGNGVDAKTTMLRPGQSATLLVELAAGDYRYICTIPGHDMLGMQGDFTVE